MSKDLSYIIPQPDLKTWIANFIEDAKLNYIGLYDNEIRHHKFGSTYDLGYELSKEFDLLSNEMNLFARLFECSFKYIINLEAVEDLGSFYDSIKNFLQSYELCGMEIDSDIKIRITIKYNNMMLEVKNNIWWRIENFVEAALRDTVDYFIDFSNKPDIDDHNIWEIFKKVWDKKI